MVILSQDQYVRRAAASVRANVLGLVLGLAACLAMPGGLVPAGPVMAASPIYVNGTTGNNAYDGTSENWTGGTVGPKATIQAGVDVVDAGGTVFVAAGSYTGAILAKDVNLVGAAGGGSVIAAGVPYAVGASLTTAFRLDDAADGSEVRNFTINCIPSGVFYFGVFARGVDNAVVDAVTVNNPVQGITNRGGSNWEITNNVVSGINVPAAGGGIGISLSVLNISGTPPYYYACSNNYVYNNTLSSVATHDDFTCPGILLALDLRFSGGGGVPIGPEDVSGNRIIGNRYTGSGATNQVGMEIGVVGLDGDPAKIAAALGMVHDNTVSGNTVVGAEYCGMWVYTVAGLEAFGNEVTDCGGPAFRLSDGWSGGRLSCNLISGNGDGFLNDTGVVVDAEGNWWGCAGGPGEGGCDSVGNNVDYTPWLQAIPGSGASVDTFTGTGTAVLSTDAGGVRELAAAGLPGGAPDLVFGHGLFSFTSCCLAPGSSATITISLPSAVPAGAQYWKYGPTGSDPFDHWYQVPMGSNDGDNVITITLTDGGTGDDDLAVNGEIVDQGGPGWPGPASGSEEESVTAFPALWIGVMAAAVAGIAAGLLRRIIAAGTGARGR